MNAQATNCPSPGDSEKIAVRLSRQLSLFLVVGTLSVMVDYVAFISLLELKTDSRISKGLSYILGMVVGFVGNRVFTFQARGSVWRHATFYAGLYSLTLLANIGTNALVNSIFHLQTLAFLTATGVSTIANFLGLKFFAFREPQNELVQ